MTTLYVPQNQWQGTPGDPHGWVSCGAYSGAVLVDAVSLGGCVPTGEQVRALTNEIDPDPADPGLTIPQVVVALRRFGCRLEDRTGQGRAGIIADLRARRWLSVSVWYPALGPYRSQKPGEFGHQMTIGRLSSDGTKVLLFDPLRNVKTGRWIPLDVVVSAMVEWGRRTGMKPGQTRYGRSRAVPLLA